MDEGKVFPSAKSERGDIQPTASSADSSKLVNGNIDSESEGEQVYEYEDSEQDYSYEEANEDEENEDDETGNDSENDDVWQIVEGDEEPVEEPEEALEGSPNSTSGKRDITESAIHSKGVHDFIGFGDVSAVDTGLDNPDEESYLSLGADPAVVIEDEDEFGRKLGLPPKLVIKYSFGGESADNSASKLPSSSSGSSGRGRSLQFNKVTRQETVYKRQGTSTPGIPFPSPLRPRPSLLFPQNPAFQYTPVVSKERARFPAKSIRRIITCLTISQDIRVSHPAVDAIAIAVECFIRSFTKEAFQYAEKKGRNLLRYDDLAYVGNHYGNLFFLQDYLPPQEAAGYVVRKVLEESGVGFPGDSLESSQQESGENVVAASTPVEQYYKPKRGFGKSKELPPRYPFDKDPLVDSATRLAKRWDKDSKMKKWRTMNRHTGKGKNK